VFFSDLYECKAAVSELTPWSEVLYEKIVITRKNSFHFMEPWSSRLFRRGHCWIPSWAV